MPDTRILKLLVPVIILELVLMVLALVDLRNRKAVTGGNKVIWAIVIILMQIFGPIAYFIFGRKED